MGLTGEESALWAAYRDPSSAEADRLAARDELIILGLPLVGWCLRMVPGRFPAADAHDLRQVGVFGLIRAIEGFRPELGSFAGWAIPRIRGAMLDEIRYLSWVPRSVLDKRARLAAGGDLGLTPREMGRWVREAAPRNVQSLERLLESGELGPHPSEAAGQMRSLVGAEALELLWRAVDSLPPRERHLMVLLHRHGHSQDDVARMWGLTPSRICQINAAALPRLRKWFADRGLDDPSRP